MTELDVKLVKVDNWGIFFLQRLKHFFNRTDYCDLTLQFQDNAQLKVHRLVLSACTEYFELLERTCEMYEDCLVMPDDLQADVVVPIVNFMYTGQLEFRMDLLERLYQTSQIMNMPVLTKLLEAHRNQPVVKPPTLNYNSIKRSYSKSKNQTPRNKQSSQYDSTPSNSMQQSSKRSYSKAFGNVNPAHKEGNKKSMTIIMENTNEKKDPEVASTMAYTALGNSYMPKRKVTLGEPRPTRYELPEELDTDNVFDNSFTSISYSSQPLVVHPDSEKQSKPKRSGLYGESNNSDSVVDIIECTKVPKRENIFDDDALDPLDDYMDDNQSHLSSNQLFDQIVDKPGPKVTIETKDSKQASNIDHAKIISEVLKKYPHLVKSNKNIKLKILNSPSPTPTTFKSRSRKQQQMSPIPNQEEKHAQRSKPQSDYTYESDVLDSKEAARLIALGAENVRGPWICLICGTPGKALHFGSYYKFRRHLVEVHQEKPIVNMCEYCGLKSLKRNYLLHHLLTKHGVPPPPTYNFPKCPSCDYVALSESLLVKHKLSHGQDSRRFRCNVCVASFSTSKELLAHIQLTGHKYCDRKTNLQCVYCQKVFLRESNLFAHLKTYHKQAAKADGIIEDSDEEMYEPAPAPVIKYEPQSYEDETDDVETQYQIRPDGNLELIVFKKSHTNTSAKKQKILNTGFSSPSLNPVQKVQKSPVKAVPPPVQKKYNEETVIIGNNEYIMRDNQLIPKKRTGHEFIIPEMESASPDENLSSEYTLQDTMAESTIQEQRIIMKKATSMNQPIQIVVSNEEEYKALMNSNHSIIFDDGDASKTLTVLSTPETPMNTPLDLENSESTDMMIIQDNYPINVPQSIATNNSNIVVVYSHPVDQQNKQFQIISSRDIGAQFVQSSPVISQNYQTVTTSASVTNNQVIDTQTSETWQIDLQQESQRNDEIQEFHEMSIEEASDVPPPVTVVSNVLSGLPEVSLTSIPPQQVSEVIITQETSEHSKPDQISAENMVENVDEPQKITQTLVDSDMPPTVVITSTPLAPEDTSTEMEIIDVTHQQADSDIPVTQVNLDKNPMEQSSENVETDLIQNSKITDSIVEHHDLTETNEDGQEHDTTEVESQITPQDLYDAPSASDQNVTQVIPIEKIQNLTSEWSEDEEDIVRSHNLETKNSHEQGNVTEEAQEMEVSHEQGIVTEESHDSHEQCIVTEESQEIGDSHEQGNVTEESQEMEDSQEQGNVTEESQETEDSQEQGNVAEESQEMEDSHEHGHVAEESQEMEDSHEHGHVAEDSQDVEESIENIQHEVEKQVKKVSEADTESGSLANLQDQPSSTQEAAPHEKISSLLHDWEENESQEANGAGEAETTEVVESEAIDSETAAASGEGTDCKKDDKIQSLVSDWDEEEEEKE